MPLHLLLARILLFSFDALLLYVSVRFMFFRRWDVTSRIFQDMTYFRIVSPQYLELILLLASMIVLAHHFQRIEHPIVVAVVLNAFALGLFVFIGMKL